MADRRAAARLSELPHGAGLAAAWTALTMLTIAGFLPSAYAIDRPAQSASTRIATMDRAREQALTGHSVAGAANFAPPRLARRPQAVRDVQQISQDRLRPRFGAQADTEVEPDIAGDPRHRNRLVVVVQEGRFPQGGAEAIGYAASVNGGHSWHQGVFGGLTRVHGGGFDRASDPAVAFGPHGAAYAVALAFDVGSCHSAIAVWRSDDGGRHFAPPVLADRTCIAADDKPWIGIDMNRSSPFYGRVYLVWTRYTGAGGAVALRYSDTDGETWSPLVVVSTPPTDTIDFGALPLIEPSGSLVVVYQSVDLDLGTSFVLSQTSMTGGTTFEDPVRVAAFLGFDEPDLRTGANITATVDPRTGDAYVAWQDSRFRSGEMNDIVLSHSNDGTTWSAPRVVNQDDARDGVDHFTPAIAASREAVVVCFRTRQLRPGPSRLVQLACTSSPNDRRSWSTDVEIGPPADLAYAATLLSGLRFLGDYMGVAATRSAVHPVWCLSSAPKSTAARHHQTTWSGSATLLSGWSRQAATATGTRF
jgi:hypothetical protein